MDLFLDPIEHQNLEIDNKKEILNYLNEFNEPAAQTKNVKQTEQIVEVGEKQTVKSRYKCESCDMSYSKRCYLSNHMEREHSLTLPPKIGRPRESQLIITEDNPRPYKCDMCVKEYTHSKHLVRHKRSHLQQYCDYCHKSFSNISEHMRKEHDIELPRPFECDICNRSYRTKSNLQAHMKIHIASNRVFGCNLCLKKFFYATDLRKHLRTHSQQRSVICDICGDGFKSVDTLRTHLRRHTGERPYQCPHCDRSFTTGNSLEIHLRTHTGEKPYTCDVCSKSFSDSSTLFVHKRLHTGENPYCCHLCGRRTKQASNLRSHYKHFHKNTDITGRQIRLNAKIFARFSQSELDTSLQESGDLMGLLAKGLEDHTKEQNEKFNETEQKLKETLPMLNQLKATSKKGAVSTQNFTHPPFKEANEIIQNHIQNEHVEQTAAIKPPKKNTRATNKVKKEKINTRLTPTDHVDFTTQLKNEQTESTCDPVHDDTAVCKREPIEDLTEPYQIMESVFVDIKVEKNDNDYDNTGIQFDETFDDQMSEDEQPNEMIDYNCYTWTTSVVDCVKNELIETDTCKENTREVSAIYEPDSAVLVSENTIEDEKGAKARTKKKTKLNNGDRVIKKCLLCQRNYQNHKTHILTYHSDIERPYECFICHKNYKKIEHLRFHFRTHQNERNFICHVCGDAYLLNSDLTKHIYNRHSNIRPFVCELCSKRFKNRHAMQIHQRVHSGEKPFTCSTCSETFAAMSSLKIHSRRHTGEKPYVCNYCHKGFSDHSTHRQHVRIHTGEKPYVCHLCGRRTTQAGNLKSHYRHYHKIIVKNVSMYVEEAMSEKMDME